MLSVMMTMDFWIGLIIIAGSIFAVSFVKKRIKLLVCRAGRGKEAGK